MKHPLWNGLTILASCIFSLNAYSSVFENNPAIPLVHMHLVSNFGSSHDPKDKQGLANFTAQMLLRGTKKRTKNAFFSALDKQGANIEVDTQVEGSAFKVTFLSENKEKTLKLVKELFLEPKWDASEFEKLKKELIGELLAEKANDAKYASKQFTKFLFEGHPYGQPTKGTESGLNNIQLEDVKGFFHTYYGKDFNLIGTGDLPSEEVLSWWNGIIQTLEKKSTAEKRVVIEAPHISPSKRLLLINKAGATQSQILIGGPAPRGTHPGFDALTLANHAYGGPNFQARLMKEVRVKRGWTYGINNRVSLGRFPKFWMTYLFPKTEDSVNALNLTLQLYKDFLQKGISKEEFEYSKNSMVNSGPFSFDTPKKRMDNATLEFLFNLPQGYFATQYQRLDKISFSEANTAVKELLNSDSIAILILGDAKKLQLDPRKVPGIQRLDVKSYLE